MFEIVGASLVDRFYTSDGWTRSKVASLIKKDMDHLIWYVIPRYFDETKDDEMREQCFDDFILVNDEEYPDCDYYAIYKYDMQDATDYSGFRYIPLEKT